jgi:hypothetical protein
VVASLHGSERRLMGHRIYTGNIAGWEPPQRFTYGRTGLEYVAPGREAALITRLLRDVVKPRGRVIVGSVDHADLAATVRAFTGAGVRMPGRASATDRNSKTRYVVGASADHSEAYLRRRS